MLSPEYLRVPRDYDEHMAAVQAAEDADTYDAAAQIVQPLGLHDTHTALAEMPMFHQHLMVRADTLHLFDGGGTMRHLILLGNWLYGQGKQILALANERLAAMVRQDDFTHFNQPLWGMDDESGVLRRVKMAVIRFYYYKKCFCVVLHNFYFGTVPTTTVYVENKRSIIEEEKRKKKCDVRVPCLT